MKIIKSESIRTEHDSGWTDETRREKLLMDTRQPKTRAEWLAVRRLGIGASEAAAVLGLSPYASPLSLFYEKTSGTQVEDDTEVQEWGLLLEPAIAAKYAQVTKRGVSTPEPYTIFRDREQPQFFCTPDRLVTPTRSPVAVWPYHPLQLKVSAYFNPKEELPLHWQIQEQHEMMVLGAAGASFAILVAGRKFYHADIERNQSFIDFLREQLEEFWDRVQRDMPPDTDGHRATAEALRRMYPTDRGTAIALPDEYRLMADDLEFLKSQIADLEQRKDAIENKIRATIADNTFAQLPDGTGFSLKTTKRDGFSVEPTTFRALRRVKTIPKGLLNQ
jgi:putative phage-type endonuclease